MTNALTEQLMRALPDGDDPLQRLKQLAQEMGIERPTRRTKRAFLRVAQRLGIECPAETHGSPAPMLDLPPAAEFVVRGREKAWRQTREEQLARAANRLQHSKVGLKVALAAKDQAAGARALRALAGFEIKPDDVGRDELAFAASLTDQQLERLMGRDAMLLPAPEALERGFQATRGRSRSIAGRPGGWSRRKRVASASRSGSSRRASRWLVAACWVHRWSGSRRRCGKASARGTADTAPLPHPFSTAGRPPSTVL